MKQMKKYLSLLIAVIFCMTMLTACGAGVNGSADSGYKGESAMDGNYGFGESEELAAPEDDMLTVDTESLSGDMEGESVYDRTDVKLIRRASVTVESTDFDAACAALEKLVEQVNGYLENTDIYQGSYGSTYRSAEYTVRVPAEKYNTFLKGVDSDEVFHVTQKNESTEDVGNDYADTEARLKALKTKRDRLNELLEQAETMEDIITIESAITDTEARIEMYSSDLTRYDRLISYATIHVTVERVNNLTDTVEDPFTSRLGKAFVEGAEDFVDFLQELAIGIVGNIFGILFLIAVLLLLMMIYRKVSNRRIKKGKRGNSDTTPPTEKK